MVNHEEETVDLNCLVFDLGKVLLKYDPERLYKRLIPDDDKRRHFLAQVCPQEWNERIDAGLPFAQAIAERQALFPQWHDEIAAFWHRWEEMQYADIPGTVEILEALRHRDELKLYVLSNFAAETFEIVRRKYTWFSHFDGLVVSAHEQCIKPDPLIFQRLEQRFAIDPARTLFIDDRQDNVEAAQSRGWQGHIFTTPEALRDALVSYGLLV